MAAALSMNKGQHIDLTNEQLMTPNRPTKKIPILNTLNKTATQTPTSTPTTNVNTTKDTSTNKNSSDADQFSPQSIAIIAGRKYIMVPKMAALQKSPESVNGNQTAKSS